MGRYLIGEEVCNNCVHWLCHTERKFSGNPPKEVYAESNCDECSVTGKNTLSKNTCAAFKHIGGITKTFPARARQSNSPIEGMISDLDESTRTLLNATMEYEKNKLAINKARQALSEDTNDEDNDDGEELASAFAKFGDAAAEQKKANDRATELLDEGMDPKYMFQEKSVEFMHMLDRARSGDPESQYEFANAFWEGSHGALSAQSLSAMNKLRIPNDWCRKAAENGLVEAQYHVGHCGWYGDEKSLEWLKKAASQGHIKAKEEFEERASKISGGSKDLLGKCITLLKNRNDEEVKEAIGYIRKASSVLDRSAEWKDSVPLYKLDEKFVDDFVREVENIAKSDVPELQNVIGEMFGAYSSFRYIVKKDDERAAHWFELSAKGGCLDAMDNLGICYAEGTGGEKDGVQAVAWYRKAAESGLDWGQYHYACKLLSGEGVERNEVLAIEWMQKAADQGLKKAKEKMCAIELSHKVEGYRKEAELGDAYGMYMLGDCYFTGRGVDEDKSMAVKLFSAAAIKGSPEAMDKLGFCYENGIRVVEDKELATALYLKAANRGSLSGQYHLAQCLRSGNGVPRDEELGVAWLLKAAKQGMLDAQYELALCAEDGRGMPKDEVLALGWCLRAATNGHVSAMWSVGRMYLDEIGALEDEELGAAWKERAKANGFGSW